MSAKTIVSCRFLKAPEHPQPVEIGRADMPSALVTDSEFIAEMWVVYLREGLASGLCHDEAQKYADLMVQ